MKICFASDLHGHLFEIPECDVLVLSGDICPDYRMLTEHLQKEWLEKIFANWIKDQKQVICTWGNHDYVGEYFHKDINIPNCKFLIDETYQYENFNFYGSPWQRRFFDWAFNLDTPDLDKAYALIPEGTDVLITHGPPYSYGDQTLGFGNGTGFGDAVPENVGSEALLEKIKTVKPKVSVFGHIHPGHGKYTVADCLLLNASIVDQHYKLTNPVFVVTFKDKQVIDCESILVNEIDWRKKDD